MGTFNDFLGKIFGHASVAPRPPDAAPSTAGFSHTTAVAIPDEVSAVLNTAELLAH